MGETSDSNSPRPISDLAKQWINRAALGDGVFGTWRLEILQKRIRANADGTPKEGNEVPLRIRRFLKGIPWAYVHDAIRYLISQSPYEDVIYNGLKLDGKYRPTLTQWRRDDQEQVGGNAQGSYTLIQDLIEVTGGKDSASAPSSDSCSETVETEWVWDSPEIEELPYSSEQGVTYAIQQVRRNEDGTFDYAIVKRVARTQVSDEMVAECDVYSTVKTVLYDNVYGGIGGEPYRDDLGDPLPIPAPCSEPAGSLVQIQRSQNPDCTFRIVVQRTESKEKTQVTETEVTLRGTRTSTTVRNNDSKVSESGLGVGDRVRNELQPDGRYTTTKVNTTAKAAGSIGYECTRTVFDHSDTKTSNVASQPGSEAPQPGNGKTYRKTIRRTEEGSYDVSEEVTQELNPGVARRSKRMTVRGIVETTMYRNTSDSSVELSKVGEEVVVEMTPGGRFNRTVTKASAVSVGDVSSGCQTTIFEHQDYKTTNSAKGDIGSHAQLAGNGKTYERTVRMTDEGSYDITVRTTTEQRVDNAVVAKRRTLRGVVETVTHRNVSDGQAEVSRVGDEIRVERTQGGLYNRTESRTTPVSAGDIAYGCSDVLAEHVDSTTVNKAEPFSGHLLAGVNEAVSVESRETEEGTFDVTTRRTRFNPVTAAATVNYNGDTHPVESVAEWSGRNFVEIPSDLAGDVNKDVSVSANANEHGSFDVTSRITQYRTVTKYARDPMASVRSTGWNDLEEILHVSNSASPVSQMVAGSGESIRMDATLNGHGSIDVSWRKKTAENFLTWSAELDTGYDFIRTVWFKHATRSDYERLFKSEASDFKAKCKSWTTSDHAPSSTSVTPTVTDEEYVERFSGSVTMRASWSGESAGNDGDPEKSDIFYATFDCSVEGPRNAAPDENGALKYYADKHDYHFVKRMGRGWQSFSDVYNRILAGKNGHPNISVDVNPVTLVWTVQVTWTDNYRKVEYNKPD